MSRFRKGSHLLIIWAMLALGVLVEPAGAEINQCLTQAQRGSWTPGWESFTDYIVSLIKSKASRDRARLIQLREGIIDIEAEKQRLIDIVEAHASGPVGEPSATGQQQGLNISAVEIPDILERIQRLLFQLETLAADGDLFVASEAFRQLKLQLQSKRVSTLCQLSGAMMQQKPDQNLITQLLHSLRAELRAIESAVKELGLYIASMPG